VLDRLRGMFAFLVWDSAAGKAFGARDPFGIKPLHYLQTPDGVYFASEKKALLPFAPSALKGDAGAQHGEPLALPDSAVRAGAEQRCITASTGIGSGECLQLHAGR
jgi:asparagine synthase (glutamine-hydrolysing)